MESITEKFGSNLLRVIKRVRRRRKDGGHSTVDQTYYVKKAEPGDRYSSQSKMYDGVKGDKYSYQGVVSKRKDDDGKKADNKKEDGNKERITVSYHSSVPWIQTKKEKEDDIVPQSVRDKFDSTGEYADYTSNVDPDSHKTVPPTDYVIWGAIEYDVLDRLKTAMLTRMSLIGDVNGLVIADMTTPEGFSVSAFAQVDQIIDPIVHRVWGDVYGFSPGEGDLSRNAVSFYELSKAIGFDDMVPPTVVRRDNMGDINAVLPDELIERSNRYIEAISKRTGRDPELVRRGLSGFSAFQYRDKLASTVDRQQWFHDLFSGDGNVSPQKMLNPFESIPYDVSMMLIRSSVLDFISMTGERSWGSILFSEHKDRPFQLVGNRLSFPDPVKIAEYVKSSNSINYLTREPSDAVFPPLLWTEVNMMLAARSSDCDVDMFEDYGVAVSKRMDSDRSTELARALVESGAGKMSVAGCLSRIWALSAFSRDIVRDPFLIIRYYVDLSDGVERDDFKYITEYVNSVMSEATLSEFDFKKKMKNGESDEKPKRNKEADKEKEDN